VAENRKISKERIMGRRSLPFFLVGAGGVTFSSTMGVEERGEEEYSWGGLFRSMGEPITEVGSS